MSLSPFAESPLDDSLSREVSFRDASFEEHRRMALRVSYCGSAYAGSQFQRQGDRVLPTVELALREAFEKLHLPNIRLSLASRTDAGVHAIGQVVHARVTKSTSERIDRIENLPRALNRFLPEDVAIQEIQPWAHPEFHAQLTPKRRWYRYVMYNHAHRNPLLPMNAHWEVFPLNIERMQTAARVLEGTHTMTAFKGSNTNMQDDCCHLERVHVYSPTPRWIVVDVIGNRFLYQMVRILVGTLLEIGRNSTRGADGGERFATTAVQMQQIMNAQDRRLAGKTAPARGLTLLGIDYPPPFDYFKTHWCDLSSIDAIALL